MLKGTKLTKGTIVKFKGGKFIFLNQKTQRRNFIKTDVKKLKRYH